MAGSYFFQQVQHICINNLHPADAAHGGLYRFWIEYICTIFCTNNLLNTEPVGTTNNSSQVTGILDSIEQ